MKKILLLILFIPVLVNAKLNYEFDEGKNYTNNYINSFENQDDYILTNIDKYGYNGDFYSDANFKNGGFLNTYEFNVSKDINKKTYLFSGEKYWTMTKYNNETNKYYTVSKSNDDDLIISNKTELTPIKITEYVKSNTKVNGKGTYSDPWTFIKIKEIKVIYDSNGGSQCKSKIVKQGNKYGTLCTPEKGLDESFMGWYTSKTFENVITENSTVEVENDITLYAKWSGCPMGKYKDSETNQCKQCPNGYTSNMGATKESDCYIIVDEGKYIATAKSSVMTACQTGYSKPSHTVNYGNTSSCEINKYNIIYDANGGSGAPETQIKTYGQSITLSTIKPTKENYTFDSWNTKEDGTGTTHKSGASYSANKSLTLYAQYKINTYTVTYNANGGSGAPAAQTKTHGVNLIISSTTPRRTNYQFKSWNTSQDGTGITYVKGATYSENQNITLYAIWKYSPPSCSCSYYYYYKVNTPSGVNCRTGAGTNNTTKTSLSNGTKFIPSGGDYDSNGSYWYYDSTHSCYIISDYVTETSESYGDNGCCGSSSGGSSSSCSLSCPSTIRYGTESISGIQLSGSCSGYYVYSSDCAIKSSSGIGQNCQNNENISASNFSSKIINVYYYTNNSNVNTASASTNNASHTILLRNSSGTTVDSCTYRLN